jgi:hypothetical protein
MKVNADVPVGPLGLLGELSSNPTTATSEVYDEPVTARVHIGKNWPAGHVFERGRINWSY